MDQKRAVGSTDPRNGRTPDYSWDRRQRIFDYYQKNKDTMTDKQIAAKQSLSPTVFNTLKNHAKWWKQLENKRMEIENERR